MIGHNLLKSFSNFQYKAAQNTVRPCAFYPLSIWTKEQTLTFTSRERTGLQAEITRKDTTKRPRHQESKSQPAEGTITLASKCKISFFYFLIGSANLPFKVLKKILLKMLKATRLLDISKGLQFSNNIIFQESLVNRSTLGRGGSSLVLFSDKAHIQNKDFCSSRAKENGQ